MESFSLLVQGLSTALEPMILLYALVGVTLGTAVGGSFLVGLIAALLLAFLAPQVVKLALMLGRASISRCWCRC